MYLNFLYCYGPIFLSVRQTSHMDKVAKQEIVTHGCVIWLTFLGWRESQKLFLINDIYKVISVEDFVISDLVYIKTVFDAYIIEFG